MSATDSPTPDFLTKEIRVDDELVVLQIWDTAGTERFHSLGNALYRGAHRCLMLFDVSSMNTFSSLSDWLKEFLRSVLLPTTKAKLVPERLALDWCKEVGAQYFKGSAKHGVDVDKPFYAAARAALQQYSTHMLENTGGNVQVSPAQEDKSPKPQCLC